MNFVLKNFFLFLTCASLFTACSKSINGNSNETIYVEEPSIYAITSAINLPIPEIDSPALADDVKTNFQKAVSDFDTAFHPQGMGIFIKIGNAATWESYTGKCDPDKSIDVSGSTLFHSASSGKTIMATLIFSLIEDGQLHLDDPVSTWFEDENLFEDVTIDHLLSHTSGIVSFEILKKFQQEKRLWGEQELVDLVVEIQERKLFAPGTALHYSNTGYLMLGIIAREVTKQTLDNLFDTRIKAKAGLNSIFYLSEATCANFTTASFNPIGEYIPLPEPAYASGPYGAGAFAGTPAEFAHFLHALLSGEILGQETLQTMLSNLALCEKTEQVEVYYGRGIKLIRVVVPGKEADYLGHDGQFTGLGFTSQLFHCMNQQATISIMTNQEVVSDPLLFRLAESFSL